MKLPQSAIKAIEMWRLGLIAGVMAGRTNGIVNFSGMYP